MTRKLILSLLFLITLGFGSTNKASASIVPEFVSSSVAIQENSDLTVYDDQVAARLTFDITAVGEDVYIQLVGGTLNAVAMNSNGQQVQIINASISLERVSGGNQQGNHIRLSDGQSGRFVYNIICQFQLAGAVRIDLVGLTYFDSIGGVSHVVALSDFNTNYIAQPGMAPVPEPSTIATIAFVALSLAGLHVRRRQVAK